MDPEYLRLISMLNQTEQKQIPLKKYWHKYLKIKEPLSFEERLKKWLDKMDR